MKYQNKKLGEIFQIARGGSPRPIQNFITDDPDGINWIMISDAPENSKYIEKTKKKILRTGVKSSRMVNPGDFLLTNSMSFGRPYIMKTSGCIHDGWLVLSPAQEIDSSYFYYLLGSDTIYREFSKLAKGTTVKNLNIDLVHNLKVSVPPIAQQKRIAAILDKADAVRRKRREAIRLTEELLRSTFLEMFGDPITNPKGWDSIPLSKIVVFMGGGTPSRLRDDYFNGSICWVTSKDMGEDIITDSQEHITQEALEKSPTQLVEKGNLLIVVKSKVLMKRLPIARTAIDCCFNQDIKAMILKNPLIARYIHRHIKIGQASLLRLARGVNTEGLTLEHLRNYQVLMPPDEKILDFCKFDQANERIIQKLRHSLAESENLFNSLLQRAFTGDL